MLSGNTLLGSLRALVQQILLYKIGKTLDPEIFSWINKIMKKLQWILNFIINTSVVVIFDNVYVPDDVKAKAN